MLPGKIQFDEFLLDCDRYELLLSGRRLKLEKIPMELLMLLATKEGDLVTRQEIVDRLWGRDVFLDTEHGINTAIRKVRAALKDNSSAPRFIQTVTGKGYRFVAETKLIGPGNGKNGERTGISASPGFAFPQAVGPQSAIDVLPVRPAPASSPPLLKERKTGWLVGGAVAVMIVVAAAFLVPSLRARWFGPVTKSPIHSLAVLPLENLSPDGKQEYFVDGITDDLITIIAKNPNLRVISRTSVMQYKKVHRPLPEIARELHVDGILEGSVARHGERVHVNLKLIHGPSETHLWAESYDRNLEDMAGLESDVARAVEREAGLRTAPLPTPQKQINPEAREAYFLGRYNWFTSSGDPVKSQEYFRRAIQLQPDYAEAWSGLADSYMAIAVDGHVPPAQVMPQAEAAARKSVELDDSLAEAHSSMAAVYLFGKWDFAGADRESRRALELNPNSAESHHLRGYVLRTLNRAEDDLQEQRRAVELDPLERSWAPVYSLIRSRRFDQAVNAGRQIVGVEPNNGDLHSALSDAYFLRGMKADAAREYEQSLLLDGKKEDAAAVERAFREGGFDAVVWWRLAALKKEAANHYLSPLDFADLYALLQRKDETLHSLELALNDRSPRLVFIQSDPTLDFLHSEPRYRTLIAKIGLSPSF